LSSSGRETQLLRDTARRLVETSAQSLNQRAFLQMQNGGRVTPSSSRESVPRSQAQRQLVLTYLRRFPRIDPYTHAVSDVYQDLTGEGIIMAKAFTIWRRSSHPVWTISGGHLLSHDLLEGSHVRVALATDIELLDVFPSVTSRGGIGNTRWVRGDWQIIDWLKLARSGSRRQRLSQSPFHFQPVENFRQSPSQPHSGGDSLGSCSPVGSSRPNPRYGVCSWWGLLLWPVINSLVALLLHPPPPGPGSGASPVIGYSARAHDGLSPGLRRLTLNAIARVAYRRLKSHRFLLEWETARSAPPREESGMAVRSCPFMDSGHGDPLVQPARVCRTWWRL
jgi:cyclic beta-1,2-glucan synthetase